MQQVPARLNTTKLVRPPVTDDYVPRLRMRAPLDLIRRRPLALVCAPAGYGKTTSVSAWLETAGLRYAWLSLSESDNDLGEFLTYLLAAMRRPLPDFGAELRSELDRMAAPSVKTFLALFHAALDDLDGEIVVVLDDFHLINNLQILSLVRELMQHPHQALHLVVLSRHDPQLPLSEWRARNRMVDVRSSDLRFSLEETGQLLQANLSDRLDPQKIAVLHRNSEGWAAGLRLAIASMSHSDDFEERLQSFDARNRYVVDYLSDEVLSSLDINLQAFLVQTSILDRMSASLCEAVLPAGPHRVDGRSALVELSRENLFIVSLDDNLEWFRYHHLFGEFLRGRLRRDYTSEQISALHMRASQWFAAAGYTDEAIRHAMAAGEMQAAVDLLSVARHDLLNHEQWRQLLALCSLFPEAVVNASPDLLLIQAWASNAVRFDQQAMRQQTEAIEALIDRLDLEPSRARVLLAENSIFRAIPAYFAICPDQAIDYIRRGLEGLPQSYYTIRNLGWVYMAMSYQMIGDLDRAREVVRLAEREDFAFPGAPRARNAAGIAFVDWMAADLAAVERAGHYALSVASTRDQANTQDWGHYHVAAVAYQRNDLARALAHAATTFDKGLSSRGLPSFYCGLVLARTYCVLGDDKKVAETMAQVREFALDSRSVTFARLAEAFEVELDVLQGRTGPAARWARKICDEMPLAAMPAIYEPQLTVAKALVAALDPDSPGRVGDCLKRLHNHVEAIHNRRYLIEVLALEALYHNALGDETAATAALQRSLALAEPSGFIRLYVDLGPRMGHLLAGLGGHGRLGAYASLILTAFPAPPTTAQGPSVKAALVEPLTEREREVLSFLARRYSNKEIAQELTISVVTVKRHTINIYQKLNVQSRRDAVREAELLGILA